MEKAVEQYGPEERRRLSVKPGITCIWQVAGRNPVLTHEIWNPHQIRETKARRKNFFAKRQR